MKDRKYSLAEIREAFIEYYHSGRILFPEEALTQEQDDEREFDDFFIHLKGR